MQEIDKRPDPEDLLKQIAREEAEEKKNEIGNGKGKLKIFLGYCAGVGKTYQMLEQANSVKQHGTDVVIAIVEGHGRKETEILLQDIEVVPKLKIKYRDLSLEEMDLDAILKRKPQLAIVDEFAHTNSPGSRHAKRYQDVEELLNAGIDVYTTLNIQHVESLVDVVYQITHVKVHETVPDRILESAELELVDLVPAKLLERLREGKVYIPLQAQTAMNKFFTLGNLLALRELSLRYTAERVDEDVLSYNESHAIWTPWPIGSRLLVTINSSTISENLLRIAHQMADELNAEWYAVYVESPQQIEMTAEAQNQINSNIRLAEELGARVYALSGTDVAKEILDFAKKKNITLIIAGLSQRSKFEEFFKGSVLNDLVKESGGINVLIVGSENFEKKPVTHQVTESAKFNYKSYFISTLIVGVTILAGLLLDSWVQLPEISGMLLLIPTIASGLIWGAKVGLFTGVIAIGALDFFFIPPSQTFKIMDSKYLPVFIVFVIVSLVVNLLAKRVKWQADSSRKRERFLSSLYSFNREMILSETQEDMLNRAVKYISEAFESHVVIVLSDENGNLEIESGNSNKLALNDNEKAAATWVFKNNLPAGKNTHTLSSLSWYFLPLSVKNKTIGVIALTSMDKSSQLSSEQNRLLESFANLVALSIYARSSFLGK